MLCVFCPLFPPNLEAVFRVESFDFGNGLFFRCKRFPVLYPEVFTFFLGAGVDSSVDELDEQDDEGDEPLQSDEPVLHVESVPSEKQ